MRENSLFTDMVEWIDNHNIIQKMSDTRQHYATLFQAMHNETASHDFKNLFNSLVFTTPYQYHKK